MLTKLSGLRQPLVVCARFTSPVRRESRFEINLKVLNSVFLISYRDSPDGFQIDFTMMGIAINNLCPKTGGL